MQTGKTKVTIIGAGPAGYFAALFLEKLGISTLLLDKETFPRNKICGDGISGWVVDVLEMLDTDLLKRLHQQDFILPSYGMRFSSPSGIQLDIPFLQKRKIAEIPPGYIAPRREFDDFFIQELRNAKHVQIKEGIEIVEIKIDEDRVEVVSSDGQHFQSEVVIIASGAKSPFLKDFSTYEWDDKHLMLGLRAYYKGIKDLHPKNYIELHFIKELNPGYLWIFPEAKGIANVGIGLSSEKVKKERINLKKVLINAIANNPILKERFAEAEVVSPFSAHPLPLYYKYQPISGNRFLLAGDSAGLIDTFTGEGIGHAALMGMYAAKTINEVLQKDSYTAESLHIYDEKLYKKINKELAISLKIPKILKYKWLFNLVMSRLKKSPKLQHKLALTLSDLDDREKLKNPLSYLKHAIFWK